MKNAGFLTLASILAGGLLFGQHTEKLSPELQNPDLHDNVDVIVQFDEVPTAEHHQKVLDRGGTLKQTLQFVKSGAYTMPASAVADLANDPSVVHISVDHKLGSKLDYTAAAINAPIAWASGRTGTGVGVAIVDSGIASTTDLNGRVVYSQNFNGGGAAGDSYGHGTHVAGIVAGSGVSSSCGTCNRSLKGMAPNANLINLRVLDQNGQSSDSMVIAAIDQAIALKSKYNIRVMNLSLGRAVTESYKLDPLCQAVEQAWQAGIVVVVAAGNDGRDNSVGEHGYGTINAPGNDPYVITVGAMKTMDTYSRTDDLIASYSSKGPTLFDDIVKPDLVAPGNQVVSVEAAGSNTLFKNYPTNAVPYSYYSGNNNNALSTSYYRLNGTSMAAAAVTGAVADLLQAQPSLTPDQVKARLMRTAYKTFPQYSTATDPITGATYTSCYDIFTVGAGYLDLAAALASNYTPPGQALSPTATFNPAAGTIFLNLNSGPASVWVALGASGASSIWGTALTNGTSGITGSSSIWGTSSTWATNYIWGTSSIWATNYIWGTSGIWGTSSIWATSSLSATSAQSSGNSNIWATNAGQSDTSIMINGEN